MRPMMTNAEQGLFEQTLNRKSNQEYLEYGSGGSTVWACNNKNIKSVTSVEVDKKWISKIEEQSLKISPLFFNPGYAHEELGRPINNDELHKWEIYSTGVTGSYDVILIDGRFRVASAAHSYGLLKLDGVLIVHDFSDQRQEYQKILELYDITNHIDTLIIATKKPNKNYKILWEKYKHNWM